MFESDPFFNSEFVSGHSMYPSTFTEWSAVNNGYRVAVWALAEVGRLDLAVFIHGEAHRGARGFVPHFDSPDRLGGPPVSLDDLALIERSMAIGFKSVSTEYTCQMCDEQFQIAGVEKSDLSQRA